MLNVIPLLFSIARHEGLKMQFITFSSSSPLPYSSSVNYTRNIGRCAGVYLFSVLIKWTMAKKWIFFSCEIFFPWYVNTAEATASAYLLHSVVITLLLQLKCTWAVLVVYLRSRINIESAEQAVKIS